MTLREQFARRPHVWAVLLILVPALLRLWFVATSQLDLVQDEAQYWDWTRRLQLTYYSKGPLIAWIIAAGTHFFGDTELGVRVGSLAGSMLAQVLIYLCLALGWKRPRAGLLTLAVINSTPLFLALGVLMTTDNPFVLCWAGAMFALYQCATAKAGTAGSDARDTSGAPGARGRAGFWPFVFLAFFLALGILAKYTMLAFVGPALVWALVLDRKEGLPRGFWPRLAKALAVGLVLGFLPTLIWNVQNGFVGYKHVFDLIGVTGAQSAQLFRLDRFPEYFGSQVGLATPWWLWFMLVGGWGAVRGLFGKGTESGDPLGLTFRQGLLLALFFWPVWLFFLAWSFHAKVLPNWTTVSYVAGAVLAALAFEKYWERSEAKGGKGPKRIALASLAVIAILHGQNLLPLPDEFNPTARLKGWSDLGQKMEALRLDMPVPDQVFLFSESYDVTAALAFSTPGHPRTYCAWLDRRMNQYDLWPGPQDKVGWDAIYVRKDFKNEVEPGVQDLFAEIGPPIHYQTTHRGAPARKFTIFLCRGYNGAWPRDDRGNF